MSQQLQLQTDFDRAAALFGGGQLQDAESACQTLLRKLPGNAAVIHLLGLVRKDSGDFGSGEQLLRESIRLDPRQADFHANLGNLLKRLERPAEAERAYRTALSLNPVHRTARHELAAVLNEQGRYTEAEAECRIFLTNYPEDAQAWCLLGVALSDQERLTEAETAYRKALTLAPDYPLAHHNLGSVLARMERAEESLGALSRAQALGVQGFEITFNRGRALLQLYRADEAEQAFAEAVALNPRHAQAQMNLAQLRHVKGDPNFARDIASASAMHRSDVDLQLLFATVVRRVGDLKGAETLLRDLLLRNAQLAAVHAALAAVLRETDRLQEAEDHAVLAATSEPQDATVIETLVSILLSRDRPDDALPFIRAQRARHPENQNWIAYEATAARLRGDPLYRHLYDYDRLVRIYEINPPPGWASVKEFNSDLARALSARHQFANHPLDQSLRNGTQTARSLLTDPDHAIRAALAAFAEPIRSYLQSVGNDAAHPMTARNRGSATISGAWSVQLRREGFHVNHIHPQGWISSAYYVAVPEEVKDENLKSGWIKFGEPRFAVPGASPERFVQPKPGRLVLFPSYMWHGTNAIHGAEPRITIAFDATPGDVARVTARA
ncbi:MAG: tetratricopeptide repeat protein [Candidatus Obscuribacterales bacterium]|nr:tetratricopeptide repeat protein [Steroidobacteraceae bacterium]